MKKKKIIHSHEIYNFETKEKITEVNQFKVPSEPSFVKMYLTDLAVLHGISKKGHAVLAHALKLLDYDGEIVLPAAKREKIAKSIESTDRTVKNQLTILVNKEILKRKSQMIYFPNPNIFAKGEWKNINKLRDEFQLTINYKNGKRTLKAKQNKKDYKNELKIVD